MPRNIRPRWARREHRTPAVSVEYVGACLCPHPDDRRPCDRDLHHGGDHEAQRLDPETGRLVTIRWR